MPTTRCRQQNKSFDYAQIILIIRDYTDYQSVQKSSKELIFVCNFLMHQPVAEPDFIRGHGGENIRRKPLPLDPSLPTDLNLGREKHCKS